MGGSPTPGAARDIAAGLSHLKGLTMNRDYDNAAASRLGPAPYTGEHLARDRAVLQAAAPGVVGSGQNIRSPIAAHVHFMCNDGVGTTTINRPLSLEVAARVEHALRDILEKADGDADGTKAAALAKRMVVDLDRLLDTPPRDLGVRG